MDAVELSISEIKNGWLVTLRTDEPVSKDWHREEWYCPTLAEAVAKLAEAANLLHMVSGGGTQNQITD
jgi:hypothetical protein